MEHICPTCYQPFTKEKRKAAEPRRRTLKLAQANITEPARDIINDILKEKDTIHWVILAEMVSALQNLSNLSERGIAKETGISKSEVHRLLLLSELHVNLKLAATNYNTEKYVLLEWMEIKDPEIKNDIRWGIESGRIRLRSQFQNELAKALL